MTAETALGFLGLEGIEKSFGTTMVVRDFSLSARRGEFISFLGPSGCGKTTVLRLVAGFERPSRGRILMDGTDVTGLAANRRNIGMVFQSYALFPNMTVAGNVGFGLRIAGLARNAVKARVEKMLALVNLSALADRYPSQLSGGQQQRVSLARAIARSPQVLLLDEPLSALDAKIRVSLREELRTLQRSLGITAIFVTHDQEEALAVSDRIVVMNAGRIEQIGTPSEIYGNPASGFVATFVGAMNVLEGVVVDPRAGTVLCEGQTVATASPLEQPAGAPVRLGVRPEEIVLVSGNGANCLIGEVQEATFLGPLLRLRTSVGRTTLRLDLYGGGRGMAPAVGEAVQLHLPPVSLRVLGAAA